MEINGIVILKVLIEEKFIEAYVLGFKISTIVWEYHCSDVSNLKK